MAGRVARGQSRDLPRRRSSEPRRRLVAYALRRRRDDRRGEGGGMILLTPDLHAALRANAAARRDAGRLGADERSEEHTSELQSLMRNSYAVFCLKKKTPTKTIRKQSAHRNK